MWTLESRAQMPTEPATVSIPLSDIKDKRVIHKAWQVRTAPNPFHSATPVPTTASPACPTVT